MFEKDLIIIILLMSLHEANGGFERFRGEYEYHYDYVDEYYAMNRPSCPKYYYPLPSCDQDCSRNCKNDESCNMFTGNCESGCKLGWTGSMCSKPCKENCYGENCNQECSRNCRKDQTCDHVTGICRNGCKPGWEGHNCTQACKTGKYGEDCKKRCSRFCKVSNICDHVSGACNGGCLIGWMPKLCDQECEYGKYGDNCENKCSENCRDNKTCNRFSGRCDDGCTDGWTGKFCAVSVEKKDNSWLVYTLAVTLSISTSVLITLSFVMCITYRKYKRRYNVLKHARNASTRKRPRYESCVSGEYTPYDEIADWSGENDTDYIELNTTNVGIAEQQYERLKYENELGSIVVPIVSIFLSRNSPTMYSGLTQRRHSYPLYFKGTAQQQFQCSLNRNKRSHSFPNGDLTYVDSRK